MLECLILGDSIAVGIHQQLPACEYVAEVGINSYNYYKKYVTKVAESNKYIISLGANDLGMDTYTWIEKLRAELPWDANVVWIVPANNNEATNSIVYLTSKYPDEVVFIENFPLAKDRVHPTIKGYSMIAEDAMRYLAYNDQED